MKGKEKTQKDIKVREIRRKRNVRIHINAILVQYL